ncbi:hypothetical protein HBI23_132680 [Parastagonospora nodorum]|nr:hypothetical protein HBI47_208500 [Parastagonospora nodorum]KAH5658486.1 hypothetical protein HBI23_132680 [Parastagonospora nodorum]
MRPNSLWTAAVALLCSVVPVVAQAELPTCAATCFASTLQNQTICAPTNTTCICLSAPLTLSLQTCIQSSCTLKETLRSINTTNAQCGIPIKDRTHALITTNVVFGSLALLALGIRVLVSLQQHIWGWDDWCVVGAWVFAMPVTVGQAVAGGLGFGRDTWAVEAGRIYVIMKIVYFNQLSYFVSATFSKLCFLFMFLRIFPAERTRKAVYIGVVLSILFPIAFGLPMTFACRPISAAWTSWDAETPYDYCINQQVFWFVAAGYNIAVDIYIVIIPIPELLKLNLSMRKKLMLVAIFSTGAITIIVSISRLWALAQYGASTNPIYDNMLSGIFSPLELNVGIIAMCMPAFRRFVARFLPRWFGSTLGSSANTPRYTAEATRRIKQDTLGGSLFQTTIMKTVDVSVKEEVRGEDEVGLVDLRDGRSEEDVGKKPDSLYRARHQETLPKNW